MSEAGQIFAMLRSWSAAEIAKRFSAGDQGGAGSPLPMPTADAAPSPRPLGGGMVPMPGIGSGAAAAADGAAPATNRSDAGSLSPLPEAPAPLPPAATRPALSLGHLAPAKAELARLLADVLMQSDSAAAGTGGTETFPAKGAMAGMGAGQAGLAGQVLAALASAEAASAGEPSALTAGLTVGLDGGDAAGPLRLAGGMAGQGALAAGTGAGEAKSADTALLQARATAGAEVGQAGRAADATQAASELRPGHSGAAAAAQTHTQTQTLAQGVAPAQLAAFAEALAILMDAGARGTATVASGVIFNAAMMPGWPYPSAFARDAGEAINPKALLHRLAAAVEGMSPQEAAEYMARVGGGHAFLRALRKMLKELDMTGKDEVKGLLFAFLETLSTIAGGLQMAFKQMATTAALQAAVVHGEDPDEGDRPGRRRLKL